MSGELRAPEGPPREPRRATGKALQCWDSVRGARRCPTRGEIAAALLPELDQHRFIVRPGDRGASAHFEETGAVLKDFCGVDPQGLAVRTALPRELGPRIGGLINTAFRLGKPLADSGSFTDATGAQILYRLVVMPLSEDQNKVDRLWGAVSFKRGKAH